MSSQALEPSYGQAAYGGVEITQTRPRPRPRGPRKTEDEDDEDETSHGAFHTGF